MYSGHDTTLSPLLSILGLVDRECLMIQARFLSDIDCQGVGKPEVGSSLTWELVEVSKIEHYVRVNYNEKYINFCQLKKSQMRQLD
jgi:hypothetical protein